MKPAQMAQGLAEPAQDAATATSTPAPHSGVFSGASAWLKTTAVLLLHLYGPVGIAAAHELLGHVLDILASRGQAFTAGAGQRTAAGGDSRLKALAIFLVAHFGDKSVQALHELLGHMLDEGADKAIAAVAPAVAP